MRLTIGTFTLTIVTLATAGLGRGCDLLPSGNCGLDSCLSTEYCAFDDHLCSGSAYTPVCRATPPMCELADDPACGCDGVVYPNPCEAATAGVDVGLAGCAVPAGRFACGYRFCAKGAEYCLHAGAGALDDWTCPPLPAACGGGGSCACLASEPCPGGAPTCSGATDLTLDCE
jgi:hypothetical protein